MNTTIFESWVPMSPEGPIKHIKQTLEDEKYLCWYVDGEPTKKIPVESSNSYSLPKINPEYVVFDNILRKVSVLNWISVDDALPVIPEGQYGVPVFVAEYDCVYEELCPGHGKDLHDCLYSCIEDREGNRSSWWEGSDKEFDFMESYSGPNGSEFGPLGDRPLFWSYVPDVNFLPTPKEEK